MRLPGVAGSFQSGCRRYTVCMGAAFRKLNTTVAAFAVTVMIPILPPAALARAGAPEVPGQVVPTPRALPAPPQGSPESKTESRLESLYRRLRAVGPDEAESLTREIELEWSKSGSPAMDLLLSRGLDALRAGDIEAAIGHLTALTDHAPDFAEGYRTRATAYFAAGMYGPALSDLETALAIEPRHFEAMFDLGVLMDEIGRPELALRAYEYVLAINPHFKQVQQPLARVTRELGGADL